MRSSALDPKKLAIRFGRVPVLAKIDADVRVKLASIAKHRTLRRDEVLWTAGDRSRTPAFVLVGELVVERYTAEGQRHVFRRYAQDGMLGVSTLAGAAHTADVRASEDSEVLLLPGEFLLKQPQFVEAAFERLAILIGQLSDDYQALLYSGIDERIYRYLRQAAMDGRREIRKSDKELADEIGASRSNVSRVIAKLTKLGVVEKARGRLLLKDIDALGQT